MCPTPQLLHQRRTIRLMSQDHRGILETRCYEWPCESQGERFAAAMASRTAVRDALIELHGPLGAGKTTFVRHLLRALGVTGRIKSPTYALLEPYRVGGTDVAHVDLYRLSDANEWADAGLREALLEPGLRLVEWPERAGGRLPPADLALTIEPDDDGIGRHVRADAFTPRGQDLLP